MRAALLWAQPGQPTGIPIRHLVGAVWSGVWTAVTASPWTALLAVLAGVLAMARVRQAIAYPRRRRDPVRRFSRADKAEVLRRAGNRCERYGLLGGRCRATRDLEADHVIPWSRSGRTVVANAQALCSRHNRSKSASVPFRWQLRALRRRRAAYFPRDADPAIRPR